MSRPPIVIRPALGMAQNDPGGAHVSQHGGGDIPGMRALFIHMAVLPAERDVRPGQIGNRHGLRRKIVEHEQFVDAEFDGHLGD